MKSVLWKMARLQQGLIVRNLSVYASCLTMSTNLHFKSKLQGEPYHMLLVIFAGSLLPYLQCLDSWLYDGILDDPYEEVLKEHLL